MAVRMSLSDSIVQTAKLDDIAFRMTVNADCMSSRCRVQGSPVVLNIEDAPNSVGETWIWRRLDPISSRFDPVCRRLDPTLGGNFNLEAEEDLIQSGEDRI